MEGKIIIYDEAATGLKNESCKSNWLIKQFLKKGTVYVTNSDDLLEVLNERED